MASAAKDLRYNHRNAVYGSLAYDLDRELRERELGHAGEAPLQREVALERPKVRSVSKVQTRERQHLSAFSVVGFTAVAALAVLVLMSYIQLTALSAETVRNLGHDAMPKEGWLPTMVPGAPAGWAARNRRFGTRPLTELFAPAIAYAREG